jgi:hypothetical protein
MLTPKYTLVVYTTTGDRAQFNTTVIPRVGETITFFFDTNPKQIQTRRVLCVETDYTDRRAGKNQIWPVFKVHVEPS